MANKKLYGCFVAGKLVMLPFDQLNPGAQDAVRYEKRKQQQRLRRIRAKREARALELRAKDTKP